MLGRDGMQEIMGLLELSDYINTQVCIAYLGSIERSREAVNTVAGFTPGNPWLINVKFYAQNDMNQSFERSFEKF